MMVTREWLEEQRDWCRECAERCTNHIAAASWIMKENAFHELLTRRDQDDDIRKKVYRAMLDMRGIDPNDACRDCGASGSKTYGSSATWYGGIGGQTITSGICDLCWGSGDASRPWTNLKELHSRMGELERLKKQEEGAVTVEGTWWGKDYVWLHHPYETEGAPAILRVYERHELDTDTGREPVTVTIRKREVAP